MRPVPSPSRLTLYPPCRPTAPRAAQAEVMGNAVTWLVPHQLAQVLPTDVDYKVRQMAARQGWAACCAAPSRELAMFAVCLRNAF